MACSLLSKDKIETSVRQRFPSVPACRMSYVFPQNRLKNAALVSNGSTVGGACKRTGKTGRAGLHKIIIVERNLRSLPKTCRQQAVVVHSPDAELRADASLHGSRPPAARLRSFRTVLVP